MDETDANVVVASVLKLKASTNHAVEVFKVAFNLFTGFSKSTKHLFDDFIKEVYLDVTTKDSILTGVMLLFILNIQTHFKVIKILYLYLNKEIF